MEDWGWFQRLRYGVVQSIGLGFLAGAMETVGLATSLKLPLSVVDFVAMGLADVAIMGGVGAVAGLFGGILTIPDAREESLTSGLVAAQMAVAGFFLCGFYLWQGAFLVWDHEQQAGAIAMAVMPFGFAGVIYYNARFWLRKTELGKAPRVGWLPVSAAVAALVVFGGGLIYPSRNTGGTYALEGDPNVILITVDGLRRSDVEAGHIPSLQELRDQGIAFTDAVSPAIDTAPAAASALTGLHPLRNKVLYDGDVLYAGFRTLAEGLEMEGYATGGFVSRAPAGGESDLDQGFRVFDDDFAPFLPGVARVLLIRRTGQLIRLIRGASAGERDPASTADRFEIWYRNHRDLPHFAWVHLAVEDESGLADVEAALARILDRIEEAGHVEDTLVVFAGANGRPDGRRFVTDPEVRIPLVVRAPGRDRSVPVVDHQVRLMDIAPTVMGWVKLDTLGETEGVDLLEYGSGRRRAPMSCGLIGRDDEGNPILGMRNADVKWVRDAEDGDHLFDLEADPGETKDLSAEQQKTVRQARTLMSPDIVAFRTQLELR